MKVHGNTTHGQSSKKYVSKNQISRLPVYNSWVNMRQRCTNSNKPDYKFYGGRGITVCERWSKFENFIEDMGEPPEGFTLDRIDVDGNYEPANCKWASRREQSNNRNYNALITFNGRTQSVGKWASEISLNITTKNLYKRIFTRGWDINRAFTQPLKGK